MKNVKIIIALLLIGIFVFSRKNQIKEITLKNIDKENILFLDVMSNKKILLTAEEKTFLYKNFKEEMVIPEIIINKISENYLYIKDGKFGLVDKNLKKILEATYDNILESNLKNKVIIKNNEKMFLYDLLNHTQSKEYDDIKPANEIGLLKVKKENKFGYINEKLEEIIPLEYEWLFDFKGERCIAKQNEGWGVISKDNIPLTTFDNQEVYLHKNGNWILKNKDGEYIDSQKREIKDIRLLPTLSDYIIYEKDSKFGIFNLEKLKKIDKLYEEIGTHISKGMIVSDKNKFDIVNPLNHIEPNYQYDYIIQIDENIYGIGNNENGKIKFFTSKNFYIEEREFEEIQKFADDLYGCIDEDKVYFYKENGEFILTTKLENVLFFNNEFIVYKSKDDYKILNFKDY